MLVSTLWQGEARVIKALTTSTVNLNAQRKRVQSQLNAESEFFQANKLVNFEAEAEYSKYDYNAPDHPLFKM